MKYSSAFAMAGFRSLRPTISKPARSIRSFTGWQYPSVLPFLMSFYSMSFPIMKPTRPRAKKIYSTAWAKKTECCSMSPSPYWPRLTMLASPFWGIPFKVVYFYLPFLIISLFIIVMMMRGKYEDKKMLEILCGFEYCRQSGNIPGLHFGIYLKFNHEDKK